MSNGDCGLCNPVATTEWLDPALRRFLPQDLQNQFHILRCDKPACGGAWMIVALHHGEWTQEERRDVARMKDILFPGCTIRWEQRQIPDHPHVHIL